MKNRTRLIAVALVLIAGPALATKYTPPELNQDQQQGQAQAQGQHQNANSSSTSTADSESQAHQEQSATGGNAEGGAATGGSSDNAVAINHQYMSRAFAQDFPITSGCFQGVNGGGDKTTQSKSTGAFLGFTFLNNSCHMQALAAEEKHIESVARLQCHDRKFRNAIAYDHRKFDMNKRERCIAYRTNVLIGAVEEERQRLIALVESEKAKHDVAQDQVDFHKSHEKVCKESLERCEEKAYGNK